jgi:hypothetical protein
LSLSELKELTQALSPLGSWVIVILGWLVVAKDHAKRERRKEVRALIDRAVTRIRACEEKALEYWQLPDSEAKANALAVSIKALCQTLGSELVILQRECDSEDFGPRLINFRRASMGEDFEVAVRQQCSPGSTKLASITDASCELVEIMELSFLRYATGKNKEALVARVFGGFKNRWRAIFGQGRERSG